LECGCHFKRLIAFGFNLHSLKHCGRIRVALEAPGRSVFVPAGAEALTLGGGGLGTKADIDALTVGALWRAYGW